MNSQPACPLNAVSSEPLLALEFGAFRLLARRRQLLRNNHAVRIGDRAFDLLTTLASRPGEIVSHADLIQQAWPKRVVCDCNLKVQIAALQKILGEAPCGGRYIRNVALRGYVFVDDVRQLAATVLAPSGSPERRSPGRMVDPYQPVHEQAGSVWPMG